MQATEGPGNSRSARALALFGGVFDPVHRGHLQVAEAASSALPVDAVVFLPAGRPAHKSTPGGASPAQRRAMLELAIADDGSVAAAGRGRFRIDPRELTRSGPSYTVLTLRELHAEAPGRSLFFVIGADNIPLLGDWYEAREVLELCTPVVYPRPGAPARFAPEHLPWLAPARLAEINSRVLEVPTVDLSSSQLRARIAAGEDTGDALPRAVAGYIEEHGLYRGDPCNPPAER